MSTAGTEAVHPAPFSPARFSKPLGNPVLNWHYRTARAAPETGGIDTLAYSPPSSSFLRNLPYETEIPSRPTSPVPSDTDDNDPNSSPSRVPFSLSALSFEKLTGSITSKGSHSSEHHHSHTKTSAVDNLRTLDETAVDSTRFGFTMEELKAMSPEKLEKEHYAMFNLTDFKSAKETRKLAKAVLGFILKDVSYTGPFYLLSVNNALYALMTIYPGTRYAEARANAIYNIACAGIHYLSGSLKYDVLNRKDFKKFRPITIAMVGMILGHLARAFYQYTILRKADWQESWPKDHSILYVPIYSFSMSANIIWIAVTKRIRSALLWLGGRS